MLASTLAVKVEIVEVKPNKISIVLPSTNPKQTPPPPKPKRAKTLKANSRLKSSDDKVAAVAAGKVTAKGPGSAKIEAAVGEKKARATIEVKKSPPSNSKRATSNKPSKLATASLTATFADDKGADVVVAKLLPLVLR